MVQLMTSEVSVAVWVLAVVQVIVSEVVAAGVAAIVASDMAVVQGGSEHGIRGWGVCRGAVG
jgi:hypothetical protein